MKRKRSKQIYQRAGQWLASALAGNARLSATIAVYAVIAILLLLYVTAQVLTGVLTQEIAELDAQRQRQTERLNNLTAEYVTLSSRVRITQYCETVLGMRQASEENYQRFAVGQGMFVYKEPVEFTEYADPLLDTYRFSTLHQVNKKSDG